MLAGFIGANICFTAGHAAELLLALLGVRLPIRGIIRWVIFGLGTLFATILTLAVIGGTGAALD